MKLMTQAKDWNRLSDEDKKAILKAAVVGDKLRQEAILAKYIIQ